MTKSHSQWKFAVDRGGTFTDVVGLDPDGHFHTVKLLSCSPQYTNASIEGIRRMLNLFPEQPLPEERIGGIRFGTTVVTNALLEREGGSVALFITKGFADLLEIGYQTRPDIFRLCIEKPSLLYSMVFEVDERIDHNGEIVTVIDRHFLQKSIEQLQGTDIDTIAIVFMHSWKNPCHEIVCDEMIRRCGFSSVFTSHQTINSIKIVSRGHSTVIDAYLSPVKPILRYWSIGSQEYVLSGLLSEKNQEGREGMLVAMEW